MLTAKLVKCELAGEKVDWQKKYADYIHKFFWLNGKKVVLLQPLKNFYNS